MVATRGFLGHGSLLAPLLLAPLFLAAFFLTSPAEDAVILYEYAKNLAQHGLVTYGQAHVPIEGATDFLWMMCIGALKAIGIDEFLSALLLNLAGAVFLVNVMGVDRRFRIAAFAGLLLTPYVYASINGFSAIFFSAVYVGALSLALRNDRRLYLALLLLCLIRPDGVVWSAGLIALKLVEHRRALSLRVELRTALVTFVIPGLLYFLARAWYFSEWLPLPFLVKATGARDYGLFYADSIGALELVLVPIVLAAIASLESRVVVRLVVACVLPALFYGAMRLEQNIGNRFLAPMFFGAMYVFSRDKSLRPTLVLIVASIYLCIGVTKETALSVVNSRTENILYLSKDLANLHGRMLATESGRLAYYSNWSVEDSWGLNTPRFAHHLISDKDLESAAPYDLVVGHCSIGLLDEGAELTGNGSRSWSNQCKVLVGYLKTNAYQVYLVPFVRTQDDLPLERLKRFVRGHGPAPAQCERFDIYAVNPQFAQAGALRDLLVRRGAVPYSSDLKRGEKDQLCRS